MHRVTMHFLRHGTPHRDACQEELKVDSGSGCPRARRPNELVIATFFANFLELRKGEVHGAHCESPHRAGPMGLEIPEWTLPRRWCFATIGVVMAEENTGSVLGVDAGMAARALGGALLIVVVAAIIVSLVSLVMFLREPIYEPTARVWVERDLRIEPPSPGPHKRLTETTPAMVRLAASRSVAE